MLLRYAMFTMLLILVVGGCGEPDSADIVSPVPEVTIDHVFYFDAYFTNAVGDFQMLGTYVDSEGNIVTYDHSFRPWSIASPWSVTVSELLEKFSMPTDTLGIIDPITLAEMYGKVESASGGDLVDSENTGDGPGVYTYCCHGYDKDAGG